MYLYEYGVCNVHLMLAFWRNLLQNFSFRLEFYQDEKSYQTISCLELLLLLCSGFRLSIGLTVVHSYIHQVLLYTTSQGLVLTPLIDSCHYCLFNIHKILRAYWLEPLVIRGKPNWYTCHGERGVGRLEVDEARPQRQRFYQFYRCMYMSAFLLVAK